jgi:molybdopterin molybdotransferase
MKTLDQIAAELQGYDPQALSADDVGAFLARLVEPVRECESVGIFEALGRVLSQDVVSPLNVPPHDNSAMDGFAFAGSQLRAGQALTLRVIGTAMAGKAWHGTVSAGECVKIMTGAVMPQGLDTVVPQELVAVRPGADAVQYVSIPSDCIQSGDNRRHTGEDIRQGAVALAQGVRLAPAALGLLASLGLDRVNVWRQLKVAYFSTGDEILSLGEAAREGAVYDSNRYTVFGLLTRLGTQMIDLGVVPDEPVALEAAFRRAAHIADAIITSGGVSVGEADHTKAMMKKLCADSGGVAFWRIAMRPGRPMAVGRISRNFGTKTGDSPRDISVVRYQNNSTKNTSGSAVLFGLPGNPVAVMVTFLAFVRPALLQMMGSKESPVPMLKARSVAAIRKKTGRTEYQRGIVSLANDGVLQVQITGNQGSGVLSSMVQANGLIVLHHGQESVAAGDPVDVMMFDGVI